MFGVASELFSRKNINCSIANPQALRAGDGRSPGGGVKVRGYVSCVLGCPTRARSIPRRWPTWPPRSTRWAATR